MKIKIVNKKRFAICFGIIIALIIVASIIAFLAVKESKTVPTISLIGDETVNLDVNDDKYEELGAKALYKDVDVTSDISIEGNVDNTKVGSYKIRYTAFNKNHSKFATITRTINIVDNVAPTITLNGKSEVTITQGEEYKDSGCTANDNYDGDITSKVSVTGEVDSSKEGTYTINYLVQDSSNNTAEATRKVTVKKKETKTVATSSNTATKINKSKKGLPVLMYHFFYNAKTGEKGADNNWMEISAFEQQMKYLADNNYYFPSWQEVESYIDGQKSLPEKSVVLTIDDGDESFIKLAIPIIQKYNVKATSFVVTSWNGDWLPKQYKSAKLDFQSHSHDMHRSGANGKGRFVNLSYKEALEDVTKSKNIIGNSTVFCYPFGHYNDNAIKVLKDAGYKLAFTTNGGRVYPGQNKYKLPRVRMSKGISMKSFIEAVK